MHPDPRIMAYTVASINGMLSAEPGDVEYNARYIAERAQEIVAYCIALEDGEEPTPEDELYYGVPAERVPAGEFEPTEPPTEEEQEKSCFHCNEKVSSTTQDEFVPSDEVVSTSLQSAWTAPTESE